MNFIYALTFERERVWGYIHISGGCYFIPIRFGFDFFVSLPSHQQRWVSAGGFWEFLFFRRHAHSDTIPRAGPIVGGRPSPALWGIVFSSDGPRASPARHCCPCSCILSNSKANRVLWTSSIWQSNPKNLFSLSLSLALASEREKEMLIKQKRLEGEVIDIQVMPVVSRQPPNNNNRRAG